MYRVPFRTRFFSQMAKTFEFLRRPPGKLKLEANLGRINFKRGHIKRFVHIVVHETTADPPVGRLVHL